MTEKRKIEIELVGDNGRTCGGCLFDGDDCHFSYSDSPLFCGLKSEGLVWKIAAMPAPPQACT